MSVLPKEHLSKAFQSRIGDFEASNSFFTVYGSLDGPRRRRRAARSRRSCPMPT